MKIEIEYEASWRNSFLDGDNNEALPKNKKARKFIGSITALKKSENSYIRREVTHNTVMGILNRLIGEQRKLYQARKDENYFFKALEPLVTFRDDVKVKNSELVYLRNMSGNFDPSSFVGSVNINHPLFSSDYSKELWSILDLDFNELIQFILNKNFNEMVKQEEVDPLLFEEKISYFKDIKMSNFYNDEVLYENILKVLTYLNHDLAINERLKIQFPKVRKLFSEIEYVKNEKLVVRALYCSALYLQAIWLSEKYTMKDIHLKGFSVNGFTPKDFKSLFTGGKKIVYGNPYIAKSFIQGEGQVTSMLTKASGVLEITIDIPRDEAKDLRNKINNAGVSSFYLGKKGLAYVTSISTKEVKKT